MGKYLDSGEGESLERGEVAFRRALEINPDLPVAHKLLAQLEVDLGRAEDAMVRLLNRARIADPELFAGLVSACRYCGLLDASVAADAQARRLDSRIRTSVAHTWFVRKDYARIETARLEEYPYIGAVALAELGRQAEAIDTLRDLEEKIRTRMRDFMIAARTMFEGNKGESLAAVNRVVSSNFRDPEGLFYLTRHLAHLNETAAALDLLRRVVAGGFVCFPAMECDPWLDPLRKQPEFTRLLREAETKHRKAADTFARMQGDSMLGVATPTKMPAKRIRVGDR